MFARFSDGDALVNEEDRSYRAKRLAGWKALTPPHPMWKRGRGEGNFYRMIV
jgi:hypothetical protein